MVSFFGDKINVLPESYIDMLQKYSGMANDSYLTNIYSPVGSMPLS